MDRSRWASFLHARLAEADGPWPCRPPFLADWRALPDDDAVHLLLDLTQAQLAADARPSCELYAARRVRATPAQPFAGHLLCEVLLETEEGEGLLAFVYGLTGIWVLDYRSDVFHRLNAHFDPVVANAADAGYYLRLFGNFIRGGPRRSRFELIEEVGQLDFVRPPPDPLPARLESTVHAIEVIAAEADPPHWEARATMAYEDRLLAAAFTITPDGTVTMTGDDTVLEDLPLRRETFMGPVRLP